MITTPEFEESYKKLNPAQKKAVDTIEGPVMVIAGPGTGKTQILTLRIAKILLETQVNPENILALTFTESGVQSMRRRLVQMIGTPGYKTEINTFHGFCNEIIKKNVEDFPRLISSESITEVEQIQILEKIILDSKLDLLKPFGDPLYYLRYILSSINDLKKEGVSVEDFKKAIEKQKQNFEKVEDLYHEKGPYKGRIKNKYIELEKDINKNAQLLTVYESYQKALQENKLYDFNDMLMEVIFTFSRNKNLLAFLQETYQYILVDEHQDTNTAQNKLIELLCNFYDSPNLFVVGDEKQAIFRFQGASLENFLYFKKLYPMAELISLEENYRSTQTILSAASVMIKNNVTSQVLQTSIELRSNSKFNEEKIKVASFSDYFGEYYFLAQDIKKKISQGADSREIAVLCRNNRDLNPVVDSLAQLGIPYQIEADQNIFTDPYVRKLILLFRAIDNFGSDTDVVLAMHCDFLKLDPLDVYKLMNFSRVSKKSIYEIVPAVDLKSKQKILDFFENLSKWKALSTNENAEYVFVAVLKESGLLEFILKKKNSLDILDKLSGIFKEIKLKTDKRPDFSLNDFLNYLNLLQSHDILIKKSVKTTLKSAVRLMTAHKSKGLEFDYVYIPQAFDGHWGNVKKRGKGFNLPWEELGIKIDLTVELEENEDERRLFYVALTRARKDVMITYSTSSIEGKEQVPSQFITEITEDHKENIDTSSFEEQFQNNKQLLFSPKSLISVNLKTSQGLEESKEFFQELLLERGFSVSALNNYLNCPWRFFYRNLLLLPDVKTKSLIFGSSIHKAISVYIRNSKFKEVDEEFLINAYKNALQKEIAGGVDFDELLNKGEKVLRSFYTDQIINWSTDLISELYIKGVQLSDKVVLNGMIDLIEPTKKINEMIVYDFKTGKPKTRAEIEGTTANSSGDYMRQLVFYKILLDRYHQGKMKMTQGGIIFVEPDTKGKFKKEIFEITPSQTKVLEDQIKSVASEILNLDFWERRCDDRDCEYCKLRDVMGDGEKIDEVVIKKKVKVTTSNTNMLPLEL